jgi:predicted LPLAT superfamily acyltransferase
MLFRDAAPRAAPAASPVSNIAVSGIHWKSIPERGSRSGIALLKAILDVGGMRAIRIALVPVVLYYVVAHRIARHASLDYLSRLNRFCQRQQVACPISTGLRGVYRHIYSFALAMAEKYTAWSGVDGNRLSVSFESMDIANEVLQSRKGVLLLVSHLGNFDIAITQGAFETDKRFRILIDHAGTRRFNDERFAALNHEQVRFYDVEHVGPEVAMELRQAVSDGEVVVIAADRVGSTADSVVEVDFLGGRARLPVGPWVMAHVLKCRVYAVFTCRDDGGYRMIPYRIADAIDLGDDRSQRSRLISAHAQDYARCMEGLLLRYPEQWYNFYPYWHEV